MLLNYDIFSINNVFKLVESILTFYLLYRYITTLLEGGLGLLWGLGLGGFGGFGRFGDGCSFFYGSVWVYSFVIFFFWFYPLFVSMLIYGSFLIYCLGGCWGDTGAGGVTIILGFLGYTSFLLLLR